MTDIEATANAKTILDQLGTDSLTEVFSKIEREIVSIAMERSHGVCQVAANILKIHRTALVEKRRKFRMGFFRDWKKREVLRDSNQGESAALLLQNEVGSIPTPSAK